MTSIAPGQPPADSSLHTKRPEIALVGNPNTGKTALFNRLTGARQRVGNYPGVTVDRKVGFTRVGDTDVSVIDLPGTYSLAAVSADERVVIDVLGGRVKGMRQPDLIVCVLDATNLLRNLFLASQVADTGLPMVLCLNMWDSAEAQGIKIDEARLSEELGVPIIKTVARTGQGATELKAAISRALDQPRTLKTFTWPAAVQEAVSQLQQQFASLSQVELTHAESLRLLFDAESAIVGRLGADPEIIDTEITRAREILRKAGLDPAQIESNERYRWLGERLTDTVEFPPLRKATHTESIDDILTHRLLGMVLFCGIMYMVFLSIYTLAGPFMDLIELAFGKLGASLGATLEGMPVLQALVENGIVAGVGGVIVFLPQILILFFFISLLEDTGYMARAAFLMDKLFSWCGLNGKSFVPMLGSYACAIPGIMSARTIEDPKARLTTILISPLMSCSARLPVYVLIIGAFIEPRYGAAVAASVLFFMHILGLIIAIPIAWILNRLVFRTKPLPFILEMPPYRVPRWRDVFWRMYLRGREFVLRAGTVIFAMSIVIWALCYFPRPAEVETEVTSAYTAGVMEKWNFSRERVETLLTDEKAREELTQIVLVERIAVELRTDLDSAARLRDIAQQRLKEADEKVLKNKNATIAFLASSPEFQTIVNPLNAEKNAGQVFEAMGQSQRIVTTAFESGLPNAIDGAYLEQSYMGRAGKFMQPVFAPAGFDWKITVGLMSSFPAREVIISTLGIIYNLGGDVDEESDGLTDAMANSTWADGSPVFTIPVALAVMVFFALCSQCGATVAVVAKETSWKWALFGFSYMTILAWIGAVITYQVGTWIMGGVEQVVAVSVM